MTGSQGWGRVTVAFLVWGACVGILLGTMLLFSQRASTSAAADGAIPSFVWFADHKTLKQINTATHEVVRTYRLDYKPLVLAVDPTDDALWVLGKHELLKLDAEANRLRDIDLKGLSQRRNDAQDKHDKGKKDEHDKNKGLDKAELLALNPYDRSLWIAGERTLLHLDKDGTLLQSTVLPNKIQAIALGLDETLWVIGERRIWQVQADGSFTEPFGLPETMGALKNDDDDDHGDRPDEPKSIRFMALDSLGEVLWLANLRHLARINLKDPNDAVIVPHDSASLEEKRRKGKHEKEHGEGKRNRSTPIYDVSADPKNGTLWLLTKDELMSFQHDGNPGVTVSLPDDLKKPEHLTFDPTGQSLWVSGKHSVGYLDLADNRVSSIAIDKSVEALGVAPFHLVPRVSLVEPPDGVYTNNAAPLIHLGLAASCNGTPCDVGETYSNAFQVDASLNGMPIGALFQVGDEEALYQPSLGLGDATYTLAAQVIDAFGHASNQINAEFTIDTVAPQFTQLNPASGTKLDEANTTLQGQVSEPATVILTHPDGTTTVGGQTFTFAVTLREGPNTFTLTALDQAGNEATVSVAIALDTVPPQAADTLLIIIGAPDNGIVTIAGQAGSVEAGAEVIISNARTGASVTVTANSTGGFSVKIAGEPGDSFAIVVKDAAGNASNPIEVSASSGEPAFILHVNPSSGVAPLNVTFSLLGEAVPAAITLDLEGDAISDFSGPSLEGQTFTYAAPGRFFPTVTVTGAQGNQFTASAIVSVEDRNALDALLQTKWAGMKAALQRGDIEGALQFIAPESRPAFEAMFRELAPVLTTVGMDLGEIRLVEVREGLAEYELLVVEHGLSVSYYVEFIRDENEQWHLKFF